MAHSPPLSQALAAGWLSLAFLWSGALSEAQVPPPTSAPASPSASATPHETTAGDAEKYVAAFAAAWSGVTSYNASVTVFEQKGAQVQNVVLDYRFRKPSYVTVRVIAGPNAGASLSWDGGPTVVARRGSGLLALFKKTYALHDPQVTMIRGSSIDQLSFGAILADAQEPGALSEAASDAIDGVAADAVTLIPTHAAADAGLTREVVDLSTVTHLPMRVLGFDGATLVLRIDFAKVVVS